MYSHKLKKVKKTNLRNKRDVVNNTHGSYTKHSKHSNNSKHSKNTKNSKNALKTNLGSLHKNTNIKNAKMPKFKQHAVLHGGASGPIRQYDEYTVDGDADMTTFSNLPDTKLIKIKTLTIRNCEGLKVLPESFDSLQALTILDIYNCNSLTVLPESFDSLQALQILRIVNCNKLQSLPIKFGDLKALIELSISSCENLTDLSESFGNLRVLKELEIANCKNLRYLPVSIGNLKALRRITIIACDSFTSLPESIGGLTSLTILFIYNCENLRPLHDSIGLCFKLESIYISNVNLLPPSVILLMPKIKIFVKLVQSDDDDDDAMCANWFDEIMRTDKEFYTIKIEKLIRWNRDTHKMLSNNTKKTIANELLEIHRLGVHTPDLLVDPEILEESFTHFYLQRPTTNTAKFLFKNKDNSIKSIVLECRDFNTFITRIRTDAEDYNVDDGNNMHANVNFFDDPVVPLPVAAPPVVPVAAVAPLAAPEFE